MSKQRSNPADSKRLSIEEQLKLIQYVQPVRCLYDKKDDDYFNLQIIHNSWKKIEKEMKTEFSGRFLIFITVSK